MLRNMSDRIQRLSTGRVALGSLVIFLLFMILVLPNQASSAEAMSGEAGSPDMSFLYSAEELYQMASSYGEEGRAAYIQARFTFDLIWPLVYGLFLATGISWTFRKAFSEGSRWGLANIAPILGVLFDYLENLSTSLVMARYPDSTPVIDWLAPTFTMLKWFFVGGSFVLLLFGASVAVFRRVSAKSSA